VALLWTFFPDGQTPSGLIGSLRQFGCPTFHGLSHFSVQASSAFSGVVTFWSGPSVFPVELTVPVSRSVFYLP